MPIDRSDSWTRARHAALGLLLCSLVLAGCGQHVMVTSAWPDKVPHNQTFNRVLIVGTSPDVNRRCEFEWALASRLKSDATQAVASCDVMPLKDPITRENIERAVKSLQPDSVLITSLVALQVKAGEGGGRDTRGAGYYKATGSGIETGYFGGYGTYDSLVVYGEFQTAPSITTMKGQVHVATRLYATADSTLVYTLDTKANTRDLESAAAGFSMITGPIADRLRRDGLTH